MSEIVGCRVFFALSMSLIKNRVVNEGLSKEEGNKVAAIVSSRLKREGLRTETVKESLEILYQLVLGGLCDPLGCIADGVLKRLGRVGEDALSTEDIRTVFLIILALCKSIYKYENAEDGISVKTGDKMAMALVLMILIESPLHPIHALLSLCGIAGLVRRVEAL